MYNCYLHQPDIHKYNLIYCNAHTLLRYIRVITTYPQQQTLAEWVTELNDTMFTQPDDEIALKAVNEKVHPSLVVKYLTSLLSCRHH